MNRKIVAEHVYPPIPIREFDWCATFSDYEPGEPQGYGATKQAAIDDLVNKAAEQETTLPLFASSVARRKWETLQADGHRMQRLYFERADGRSGHIDAWGAVTWSDGTQETQGEQA